MKKSILLSFVSCLFMVNIFAQGQFFDLEKKEYTYEQLIASEKTVLFVWATWCPSCRTELSRVAKDNSLPQDVNVLFVSIGESSAVVENTLKKLNIPENIRKKIIIDPFELMAQRFFISGVPTVLYLKNGEVIRTAHSLNKELLFYIYPQTDIREDHAGRQHEDVDLAGNIIDEPGMAVQK